VNALEGSVRAALGKAGIGPGSTLLAAVSGGPDSTALLRVLAALRESRALTLTACIVDHGMREEQVVEADISFVRGLCDSLGIRLDVVRIPHGECAELAKRTGRSLEEVARESRQRLLKDSAHMAGAHAIMLGHTEDDTLETLLMRVLQGSDVSGLSGIPLRRGPFVRPLLRCTRAQVMEYLATLGQVWREDSTNRDTRFLRNRIRHILVPILQKNFPGFRTGLLALSSKLKDASDLVRELAAQLPWETFEKGFTISRRTFYAAPPAVRAFSLLYLYDTFKGAGAPRRLPWRFLSPALAADVSPLNRWILRGHGTGLSTRGNKLFWGPDIASRGKKGYSIVVCETGNTAIRGTGLCLNLARNAGKASAERGAVCLLRREVDPPIVLRSIRKGDEILLQGGMTSVKELLGGWKVLAPERERIPLLADRRGILAVLGGALGYRTRTRAGAIGENPEKADCIEVTTFIEMEEGREQQQR